MEIPVFLFTGFLESGKTTFIQEALEGDDFNIGERTLLLLCEEGEVDFQPEKFFGKNVFIEPINKEQLKRSYLEELRDKHKAERVVVEYNGMWELKDFYDEFPQGWIIYQQVAFFQGESFLTYNKNMRQLVYDKLKDADMIVFNRVPKDFDKMEYHKTVRAANLRGNIIYEYGKDDVELDTIEDPLPYDLEYNGEILIKDEWYAPWYRDINENQDAYEGKTFVIKGRVVIGGGLAADEFVFGRHIMTCCEDDIQFAGLVCNYKNAKEKLEHGSWAIITGTVKNQFNSMYGEVAPVIYCTSVEKAKAANPEVAQF